MAAASLIATSTTLAENAELRLILVAILFAIVGLVFLCACFRLRLPRPPARTQRPLQLLFDPKEQVHCNESGQKTVSVLVRNPSDAKTLVGIVLMLQRLDALHRNRFAKPVDLPATGLRLRPESPVKDDDSEMSLGPGESLSFPVARSVVGDVFLYIPQGCLAGESLTYTKVPLAPYLATITATAKGVPFEIMALELPVAGRSIGTPSARRVDADVQRGRG